MKLREEFRVDGPLASVWEFLEEPERVARCVPGVEALRVIDADHVEVRATQSIGPMSATFDATVTVQERDPYHLIRFQATGRSVRGAVGNIRASNTVRLDEAEGGTLVSVEGDVILAGAIGSVGQKVVAKQAGKVTAAFAENLRRSLAGEPPDEKAAATTGAGGWQPVESGTPRAMAEVERWAKASAACSAAAAALSLIALISQRRGRR